MKIRALTMITSALALTTALAVADDNAPKTDTPPSNPPTASPNDKSPGDKPMGDKPMGNPSMTDKSPGNAGEKLSAGDMKIISHLHHVNMMEIEMGKAAQKSGTAAIKTYAQTLVTDHQTGDKDL